MSEKTRFIEKLNEEADSFTADVQNNLQNNSKPEEILNNKKKEVIVGRNRDGGTEVPVTLSLDNNTLSIPILVLPELANQIESRFNMVREGSEEEWGTTQANILADRLIVSACQTYLTMLDVDNCIYAVYGFTKVLLEYQIGKMPQVLIYYAE